MVLKLQILANCAMGMRLHALMVVTVQNMCARLHALVRVCSLHLHEYTHCYYLLIEISVEIRSWGLQIPLLVSASEM